MDEVNSLDVNEESSSHDGVEQRRVARDELAQVIPMDEIFWRQ